LVIQRKSEILLDFLEQYQNLYNSTEQEKRNDLFLSIRKHFNEQRLEINYKKISENWMPRAAQFIFLNKTCFNGLFRLNSKGEFNVPYGKYKTASVLDIENINAVHKLLQKAKITYSEYSNCYSKATEKSFIYFDPPYRPITHTSNFTAYIGNDFCEKQQIELAKFYRKLDEEKGARLMLSNSDPTSINPKDNFFKEVYDGYNISKVSASRAINCKGNKRGRINELLITNYSIPNREIFCFE
jgi:DNA adenine methylase